MLCDKLLQLVTHGKSDCTCMYVVLFKLQLSQSVALCSKIDMLLYSVNK